MMNCLSFKDKQSYLSYVNKLSDEEVILERRVMSNLLEKIKYDYNMFRSKLYTRFISIAKMLQHRKSNKYLKEPLHKLLMRSFSFVSRSKVLLDKYDEFHDDTLQEDDLDRELSIQDIERIYDKIMSSEKHGYLTMFNDLVNVLMNFIAGLLYKNYDVVVIDRNELEKYKNAPNFLYGGLDENGDIDYKFALNRFYYQLMFSIDFFEGKCDESY